MDMDLDFSDDKIECFLSAKLEEIRCNNESLENVLSQQKDAFRSPSGDIANISFKVIESDSWKRIYNNKYTIEYIIFTDGKRDYKDIKVLLTWNSEEAFCYKVETFGDIPESKEDCTEIKNCSLIIDTVKQCNIFKGKTYLVVIFDVPQFLDKSEYKICGIIVCTIEGQNFNIPLPKINISAKDSTTSTCWVIQNSLHNIFSLMTCSDQTDLVMILPEEWTASLVSTFEIHCALTHLKMSIPCKLYFVAYNVSKSFDNTLIVVHFHRDNKKTLFLTIYAASNDQMYALCHHLGSCLPNIIFFPLSYYKSHLCKNAVFTKELLKEFGKSMCEELELSYKFAQNNSNNGSQQLDQFRSTLSLTESNTDKLFLEVSNMKY